ncbi:unnamed protein product [Urochloa decumbens]|uniref:Myb-like domain-containing protein n=1 Tax=Urochloa decumbens TaxID=240449 RepID=A0ABC9GIL3_9POAL
MENSSSGSFTNLLNSSIFSSSDPKDTNTQQQQHHPNFQPHHYPLHYPPPHIQPSFHGHYPHNTNPFPGPNYSSLSPTPASYHGGPYPGNIGQYLPGVFGGFAGNSPASPMGSMSFFPGSGGSGSRGDESSPIASSPPASGPSFPSNPTTDIEEWSDASEDEAEKTGGRIIWNQEDDLRLVSSWLKNSNDPILGNGKKGGRYWKDVADEYNRHAPEGQKRTAVQCKEHWNKTIPHINKFNGVYNDICSTYPSGHSEDQIMEKVRAKYKRAYKKKRPFAFEHWWRGLKDQPKWSKRSPHPVEEMQKRARLNESGAYTSSTQETEGADEEVRRPQGQKAAKAERKNKGKAKCQNSDGAIFTEESMKAFNELQLRKSIVAEKMADAALIQAEAEKEQAIADKEKAAAEKDRTHYDKLNTYMQLVEKDTRNYDDDAKARHNRLLDYLARDLGLN